MTILLLVSATLLVLSLGLKHFEYIRGERVFETTRLYLDQATDRTNHNLVAGLKYGIEYVHKDVFLNGLHMVTYVALLFVRFIEIRLEKGTFFLRSFRKKKKVEKRNPTLEGVERGDGREG